MAHELNSKIKHQKWSSQWFFYQTRVVFWIVLQLGLVYRGVRKEECLESNVTRGDVLKRLFVTCLIHWPFEGPNGSWYDIWMQYYRTMPMEFLRLVKFFRGDSSPDEPTPVAKPDPIKVETIVSLTEMKASLLNSTGQYGLWKRQGLGTMYMASPKKNTT